MNAVLREELGRDIALMGQIVQSQLRAATNAFFQRDVTSAEKVIERDDQVDNLLSLIEERCFTSIAGHDDAESARARGFRGGFRVALNLEKLGDYAVNIAEQALHGARLPRRPPPFDLSVPTRMALTALDDVLDSFTHGDADKAKDACRREIDLDRQYREALGVTLERLRHGEEDPAFLITNLFVSKFLERVGDAILNIGETTLFILTGERLKLHQYLHLEEMMGALGGEERSREAVDIRPIWGGISGARLGRLSVGGRPLIWKEGAERKIEDEIRQMEEWNQIVPGLVPNLKARYQKDGRESFIGQFLDGILLRDVYLARSWPEKMQATQRLLGTLREVWTATMREGAPRVDYVRQIIERLPEFYAAHPSLAVVRRTPTTVFGIPHRSLGELLERVRTIEPRLAPKMVVRIHGDFNTNNVIYDAHHDRVHFIDVHRSEMGDYVQDIGVLLVSNLRIPIDDARVGSELRRVNELIIDFAREFARLIADSHFESRLTLSRARSLITSARLVADMKFARRLYLEGVRLLERAAAGGGEGPVVTRFAAEACG